MASVVLAAVDAPVTQVTVFTDRARVVRTARLTVSGTQTVELPTMRDTVEPESIRVEAIGAEVSRVDITRIESSAWRADEARAFLAEVEAIDDERSRSERDRQAWSTQRELLLSVKPVMPVEDQPAFKLNASGWAASMQFMTDRLALADARLLEADAQLRLLAHRREELIARGQKLGSPDTVGGWRVAPILVGNGPATVTYSYVVPSARWQPSWDLQLNPEANEVTASLAGLVAQDSGEDWVNAALMLSTAMPSRSMQLPSLRTWKIGVADRFVPRVTPRPNELSPLPPPVVAPVLTTDEKEIKDRLSTVIAPMPIAKRGRKAPERSFGTSTFLGATSMESTLSDELGEHSLSSGSSSEGESMISGQASAAPVAYNLAPPSGYRPQTYGASSPVTLAAGYDLSFTSLKKETIESGKGERRVALWSQRWPVSVERRVFPAVSSEAYLVAELKNPSQQVLPGGPAQLSVGADPAGTARLELVSPGEAFTLPLGIDRAIKSVRNLQVVEATEGVVAKDEVSTYTVTIEVANPHSAPVAMKVFDQWPLTKDRHVEIKLIDSKPGAAQKPLTGGLEWSFTLGAGHKQVITFSYSIKRPQGWRLFSEEVRP